MATYHEEWLRHDARRHARVSIRAPRHRYQLLPDDGVFNPRTPRGARHRHLRQLPREHERFNPRPADAHRDAASPRFQSARPARSATTSCPSPRAPYPSFNPRAPRGARRCRTPTAAAGACFNPRGARRRSVAPAPRVLGFNPRAPRGARRRATTTHPTGGGVSIRAPRAGRDSALMSLPCFCGTFQSARPARGATPVGTG